MKTIAGFGWFIISLQCYAQSYFQQQVNYKIDVKLDDVKHEITAFETIEYINNSPDELNYIYFHLWPNAYKNINTAWAKQMLEDGNTLFYFSKEEDKGYIDQLDFRVNDKPVLLMIDSSNIDIARVILNERLKPGEKITLTTPFHVKIPNGMFSRMGHEGQQYQITQWYPKPAVYDKKGWHPMPYLEQGEFYSEFGTYDVAITVPKNYVVGATGDLQDEEEKKWIDQKANETLARDTFPNTDDFPASDTAIKTLHFKQENVHDFAWFCDKRYNVMRSRVDLPHTHRTVTTWALFTNGQAKLWKKATAYINDALYNYSLWNGDYPYNNCTAVDGALSAGAGMEYPNITVINATSNAFDLDDVITHEVGHNWFYGVLGSNERDHAWMDEGINSYNEYRYIKKKYPNSSVFGERKPKRDFFNINRYSHVYQGYITYLYSAAQNVDEPCDQPAAKYTKLNYAGDVYAKTGLVFDYLQAYLGDEVMDRAMQQYFETWKFKHPSPDDLQKIMEDVSGKKLNWIFDDLIKTTKKLDYKITTRKKRSDGSYDITIKNKAEIKSPVSVCGIADKKMNAQVWSEGFAGKQTVNLPAGTYNYFKIDFPENIPELNRNNNTIKNRGILKKVEPLKLQPFVSIDNPDKTQLFFTPAIGANNYNRFMLGVAAYNITIPEKRFEYVFVPMFGFENQDLAGYGSVNANFHPNKLFRSIAIGVNATRFAYLTSPLSLDYNKIAPQIEFVFRNKESRSPFKHSLKLRSVTIFRDILSGDYNFTPPVYSYASENYTINQLLFTRENKRTLNPYIVTLDLQQSKDFVKTSVEAKYEITFKKKKSINFRFFAGTFLNNSSANAGLYSFRTSGWIGYQDYLYDHVYLGRSEPTGFLSQQFVERDGGFKIFSFIGQTTQWLTALNIKSSIPGKLPIRLYADIGLTAPSARLNNTILYDAGIDLSIVKDICEIYFPILLCNDFTKTLDAANVKYGERIRFTLNINMMNPFGIIKTLKI